MSNQPALAVIICCYNSERVIGPTLEALARQEGADFPWEVVSVDNNCSDTTQNVARETWEQSDTDVPLKIVEEPTPGLASARKCGVYATEAPLLIFCDDDNQFASNYLQIAKQFMDDHVDVSACGGKGRAITDGELPVWFDRYKRAYAVGPQSSEKGEVQGHLYGAGIVLRRNDLLKFYECNIEHLLSGRKGGTATAGDDGEMQEWLDIFNCGKRFYLPELTFDHYLLQPRLNWAHLTKLYKGFGQMSPVLSTYKTLKTSKHRKPKGNLWWKLLLKYSLLTTLRSFRNSPKDSVLLMKRHFASITWLLKNRREFKNVTGEIVGIYEKAQEQGEA